MRFKKALYSILSLFLLLIGLSSCNSNSNYEVQAVKLAATTSSYKYCSYYSYTKDMDPTNYFGLISIYTEYINGVNNSDSWELTMEHGEGEQLMFTGTYPNGTNLSSTSIGKVVTSNLASYCIGSTTMYDKSVIIVDYETIDNKEDINAICKEAFATRLTNVKDPEFDFNIDNINYVYNKMNEKYIYASSESTYQYTTGAGEDRTLTARLILISDSPMESNTENPSQSEDSKPSTDNQNGTGNTSNNGNQSNTENPSQNNEESSGFNPVDIFLWVSGILLGGAFIVILVSTIRMVVRWLKE